VVGDALMAAGVTMCALWGLDELPVALRVENLNTQEVPLCYP